MPFFSISGSEFVEVFVGVGAARVRDLFKKVCPPSCHWASLLMSRLRYVEPEPVFFVRACWCLSITGCLLLCL